MIWWPEAISKWFTGDTPWYTMIHPVYITRNYNILQAIWFLQGNQLPVEYSCRPWSCCYWFQPFWSSIPIWNDDPPFALSMFLYVSLKGSNHHPFPFHHPSFLIVFASLPYTKSLEKTPAQNSSWLGSQILWVQRSAGLWPDQGWPGSMTGQGWPGNMCILWKLNMESLHITASTVIITLLRSYIICLLYYTAVVGG